MFLNVDLEVGARTRADLAPILEALDGKVFELFRGRLGGLYRVHVQAHERRRGKRTASSVIHELADVIEALPPAARRAWASAKLRDFNVGVELARDARSVELAVEPAALRRVDALGGRLVFTAYPA